MYRSGSLHVVCAAIIPQEPAFAGVVIRNESFCINECPTCLFVPKYVKVYRCSIDSFNSCIAIKCSYSISKAAKEVLPIFKML